MTCTNYLGKDNLTLLTDFYEFTMSHGFFAEGVGDRSLTPWADGLGR